MADLTDIQVPSSLEEFTEVQQEAQEGLEFKILDDGDLRLMGEEDYAEELPFNYNEDEHYENLVNYIDDEVLKDLGAMVKQNYEDDDVDRGEWLDTLAAGLDMLGLKPEDDSGLFEGACAAHHPLLMESAVKFQSKASNELLPSNGPVKCKILGSVTEEKEEQALRVKKHMNYQVTELMTEFYSDKEKLLLFVPILGSAFTKTYYDSHLERPVSEFVPPDQFVVPNDASDLHRASRYTHILYKTEYELEADFASGLYERPEGDRTLSAPEAPILSPLSERQSDILGADVTVSSSKEVYTIYEQHIECCIEGIDPYEGKEDYKLASPYIITIEATSGTVLGVRRNWRKGDVKRKKQVIFTHYSFVPGFGFYALGYLHLLGNLQLSLTSTLRSLIDAGQFANLQGGFKMKGVRIKDNGDPIAPGQFKDVETPTGDIRNSIMPLPFKEPSTVLYQMLDFLDRKGQKFADSTDQVIADSTNYGPVGTTMALLEASNKFFSAIHKRLHKSLKDELRIISRINADTLPENLEYNIENETIAVSRKDYDDRVDVTPVSDPNISSSAHRMAKAQNILQAAQMSPEQHDMREAYRQFYTAMEVEDVDKLLPLPEQAQPQDPLTDIQLAVQGKPIKAFEGQDHDGHVNLKMAFLQDPQSGGSPAMAKAAQALQTNIQEHLLLKFSEQVKAQGGDPAQAAQQVAQMNLQKAQQEAEAAKQDDAAMILAQAELLDTQTQQRKQAFEEQLKTAQLELEKEKLDTKKLEILQKSELFDRKVLADLSKEISTRGLDILVEQLTEAGKPPEQEKTVDKEE